MPPSALCGAVAAPCADPGWSLGVCRGLSITMSSCQWLGEGRPGGCSEAACQVVSGESLVNP